MSTEATKVKSQISKTERTELRRLLGRRFQVIEAQFKRREEEIREALRKQVTADFEAKAKEYERKAEPLFEELDAAVEKLRKLEAQAEKDGVTPGEEYMRDVYVRDARGRPITDPATGDHRRFSRRYTSSSHIASVNTTRKFVPKDLDERVSRAFDGLADETGFAAITLEGEKLRLEEELAFGALQSEDARSFLDKLPVVDKYLPAPNGEVKALIERSMKEES